MKTWAHAVRDARLTYINRDKFAYLWGANGEYPRTYAEAKSLVDRCWAMNPEHFKQYVTDKGHSREELISHVLGRRCFDCSSFVCAVTQYEGSFLDMHVLSDYNSYSLRENMKNVTTLENGTWGNCLWKSGHVALDVGNGLAIDFGAEFVDVREYRFIDPDTPTKFTLSGQLPWVDFRGAINV